MSRPPKRPFTFFSPYPSFSNRNPFLPVGCIQRPSHPILHRVLGLFVMPPISNNLNRPSHPCVIESRYQDAEDDDLLPIVKNPSLPIFSEIGCDSQEHVSYSNIPCHTQPVVSFEDLRLLANQATTDSDQTRDNHRRARRDIMERTASPQFLSNRHSATSPCSSSLELSSCHEVYSSCYAGQDNSTQTAGAMHNYYLDCFEKTVQVKLDDLDPMVATCDYGRASVQSHSTKERCVGTKSTKFSENFNCPHKCRHLKEYNKVTTHTQSDDNSTHGTQLSGESMSSTQRLNVSEVTAQPLNESKCVTESLVYGPVRELEETGATVYRAKVVKTTCNSIQLQPCYYYLDFCRAERNASALQVFRCSGTAHNADGGRRYSDTGSQHHDSVMPLAVYNTNDVISTHQLNMNTFEICHVPVVRILPSTHKTHKFNAHLCVNHSFCETQSSFVDMFHVEAIPSTKQHRADSAVHVGEILHSSSQLFITSYVFINSSYHPSCFTTGLPPTQVNSLKPEYVHAVEKRCDHLAATTTITNHLLNPDTKSHENGQQDAQIQASPLANVCDRASMCCPVYSEAATICCPVYAEHASSCCPVYLNRGIETDKLLSSVDFPAMGKTVEGASCRVYMSDCNDSTTQTQMCTILSVFTQTDDPAVIDVTRSCTRSRGISCIPKLIPTGSQTLSSANTSYTSTETSAMVSVSVQTDVTEIATPPRRSQIPEASEEVGTNAKKPQLDDTSFFGDALPESATTFDTPPESGVSLAEESFASCVETSMFDMTDMARNPVSCVEVDTQHGSARELAERSCGLDYMDLVTHATSTDSYPKLSLPHENTDKGEREEKSLIIDLFCANPDGGGCCQGHSSTELFQLVPEQLDWTARSAKKYHFHDCSSELTIKDRQTPDTAVRHSGPLHHIVSQIDKLDLSFPTAFAPEETNHSETDKQDYFSCSSQIESRHEHELHYYSLASLPGVESKTTPTVELVSTGVLTEPIVTKYVSQNQLCMMTEKITSTSEFLVADLLHSVIDHVVSLCECRSPQQDCRSSQKNLIRIVKADEKETNVAQEDADSEKRTRISNADETEANAAQEDNDSEKRTGKASASSLYCDLGMSSATALKQAESTVWYEWSADIRTSFNEQEGNNKQPQVDDVERSVACNAHSSNEKIPITNPGVSPSDTNELIGQFYSTVSVLPSRLAADEDDDAIAPFYSTFEMFPASPSNQKSCNYGKAPHIRNSGSISDTSNYKRTGELLQSSYPVNDNNYSDWPVNKSREDGDGTTLTSITEERECIRCADPEDSYLDHLLGYEQKSCELSPQSCRGKISNGQRVKNYQMPLVVNSDRMRSQGCSRVVSSTFTHERAQKESSDLQMLNDNAILKYPTWSAGGTKGNNPTLICSKARNANAATDGTLTNQNLLDHRENSAISSMSFSLLINSSDTSDLCLTLDPLFESSLSDILPSDCEDNSLISLDDKKYSINSELNPVE